MRNGDMYGIAVRVPNGDIFAQRLRWKTFLRRSWLKTPFIRGFPILLETLVNGIQAINRSVALAEGNEASSTGFWSLFFSLCLAALMAIALFVVAPHLLSLLMLAFNWGTDVEGFSFHLWDGFYKCAIFVGYIWAISFVPDIRHVFEYHGAEHKTICAWESGSSVDANMAFGMSRLHPRCGTTFILFVIVISIILQSLLVPGALQLWGPHSFIGKHIFAIALKLLLVIPISAVAYELIRFAARLPEGPGAFMLQAPGLALQYLTTREPSRAQIEVALVALVEALDSEDAQSVIVTPYKHLPAIIDA